MIANQTGTQSLPRHEECWACCDCSRRRFGGDNCDFSAPERTRNCVYVLPDTTTLRSAKWPNAIIVGQGYERVRPDRHPRSYDQALAAPTQTTNSSLLCSPITHRAIVGHWSLQRICSIGPAAAHDRHSSVPPTAHCGGSSFIVLLVTFEPHFAWLPSKTIAPAFCF